VQEDDVTRPLRPFVTALALLLAVAGVAACGIDEDQVAAGGPTTASTGEDDTTTSSTTETTEAGGPDISLPDIPSDVTEPDDTIAEPSTVPDETLPDDGSSTPGGLTPDALTQAFIDEGFTPEQATCITIGTFASLSGDEIDQLASGDESQIDPDVYSTFEEIVQTCVQGG
jgi:hypothetical protein